MKLERATPDAIERALATDLGSWRLARGPGTDNADRSANYLVRDFTFPSFTDAVRFMMAVAPQFEVAYHHPSWENEWRRLTVRLTTWDLHSNISLLDIMLARFLESRFNSMRL
jgi:pterin-4a-carbinolamine dehydratase